MSEELDVVWRLERSLHEPRLRSDRERLERLLHADFVEFGTSGRRWGRSEIIEMLVSATHHDRIDVSQVTVRPLSVDGILVTYQSRTGPQTADRASVWVRHEERWQIVFHQGTPTADAGGR